MLRLANPPGAYEGAGTHSIIPHPTQTCSKHYERRAGLRELVEAAYSGSCAGILQSALAYQHVILVLKFAEAPHSPAQNHSHLMSQREVPTRALSCPLPDLIA